MQSTYHIQKLDSKNYESWRLQMKSILVRDDLWGYVDESIKRPSTDAADWTSKDAKALATLILGVSPSELVHINTCQTSAEAWTTLSNLFQPSGPARKVSLFKELVNLKLKEGESMSEHLKNYTSINDNLKTLEILVPDEVLSIMLLCSLPDSYEAFTVAIGSRDALPDFASLKSKLLEEERRRGQDSNINIHGVDKVLNVKQRKKKKNIRCYICGKKGHIASECWSKKAKAQGDFKPGTGKSNRALFVGVSSTSFDLSDRDWSLDSGATSHICCKRNYFKNFRKEKRMVALADGKEVKSLGIGMTTINYQGCNIDINNVLFVPDLRCNFISVSKVTDKGNKVQFQQDVARILDDKGVCFMEFVKKDSLYVLNSTKESLHSIGACDSGESARLWHYRLGHINIDCLRKVLKHTNTNIHIPDELNCSICYLCKMTRGAFSPRKTKTKSPLELIYSDICGPMRAVSAGGARYFVTFIDDYTRMIFVYFLKSKGEVLAAFKRFKLMAENQSDHKIKKFRSDNAKEYLSRNFEQFLMDMGIVRETTVEYTPQQNGIAERANRTIVEMVRCMLLQSNLPHRYWAEAVNTSVYIRNHVSSRAIDDKIPWEVWSGKKVNINNFKVFGSRCFALDNRPSKDKLSPKSKEYTLVGYSDDSKSFRLLDPKTDKIIKSRDVKFVESCSEEPKCLDMNIHINEDYIDVNTHTNINVSNNTEARNPQELQRDLEQSEVDEGDEELDDFEEKASDDEEPACDEVEYQESRRGPGRPRLLRTGKRGRPRKIYNQVNLLDDGCCYTLSDGVLSDDPISISEALQRPDAKEWKRAIQEEHQSLINNNTWELVNLPKGKKPITCRWVFHIKRDARGNIEKYKARLVARGFSQRPGIDYNETFAPVLRWSTLRTIIALCVEQGYKLHQIDINSAYLNGEITEEIYMEQPEGFSKKGEEDKVCLLKKSLYGLKQAGRCWNIKFDQTLKELGFKRSESDPCIYHINTNNHLVIFAVYVDDILIASKEESLIGDIKKTISQRFKMSDKGIANYILGVKIDHNEDGSISLSQQYTIKQLLERQGMLDCKAVSTPLDANAKINKCFGENCTKVDPSQYQNLIGSLLWISNCTRPDIAHSVNKLAQFNSDPHSEHLNSAKRILRYLKGTMNIGITYRKTGQSLIGYADADWAGDLDDRKSYSGWTFLMAGAAISWESRKQNCVSQSSTEAEYVALSEASKECVYLKRLLREIGGANIVKEPITINSDNQSAIKLAHNPINHKRSKHIEVKYHFIRECIQKGILKISYTPSEEMIADILTKSLFKTKHGFLSKGLGLEKFNTR